MITIVNYGLGNLGSIANMLRKAGDEAQVSSDLSEIERADKLVLPGVGAFDTGMHNLHNRGLVALLNRRVLQDGVPILGLCLGLQLFTRKSEEGEIDGLGWIDAETIRFPADRGLRVPHMGWNTITIRRHDPLLDDLGDEARFYFVHSYFVRCANDQDLLATTQYGCEIAAVVRSKNVFGTQFHPEKSHKFGLKLMRNFIEAL
jgi:imidazole glycerol-phosphate synthase subunit HisH